MLHYVDLEQEDVAIAPTAPVVGVVVIDLTVHGLAKLDEARTKYGPAAVFVRLAFPSDEFYPSPASPKP
jgi:hypothetical protein